jgi:hypothetical protein
MGKELKYNFPDYSNQDWLNTIAKELKQNLNSFPEFEWELGLSIPVNGTAEKIERGAPGQFPFAAGWNKNENSWSVNQSFISINTNKQILEALANDVSSITL